MDSNRSRAATLIGVAAAAGAFGAVAMTSAATAPTARADTYTDIIAAIDAELTAGATDYANALTDFSSSDVNGGLSELFSGVDDDLLGVPNNIVVGTVDALTNESDTNLLTNYYIFPESTVLLATDTVQADFSQAGTDFSNAASDLSSGDYGDAVLNSVQGLDLASLVPAEEALFGVSDALGF